MGVGWGAIKNVGGGVPPKMLGVPQKICMGMGSGFPDFEWNSPGQLGIKYDPDPLYIEHGFHNFPSHPAIKPYKECPG